MLLNWFDAKEAKEFGIALARFHIEKIPLDSSGAKNKPMAKKQEALNKLFQQMARFKLEHRLNIYKKAQLGNAFKWALRDAGYEAAYVDQITRQLMLV